MIHSGSFRVASANLKMSAKYLVYIVKYLPDIKYLIEIAYSDTANVSCCYFLWELWTVFENFKNNKVHMCMYEGSHGNTLHYGNKRRILNFSKIFWNRSAHVMSILLVCPSDFSASKFLLLISARSELLDMFNRPPEGQSFPAKFGCLKKCSKCSLLQAANEFWLLGTPYWGTNLKILSLFLFHRRGHFHAVTDITLQQLWCINWKWTAFSKTHETSFAYVWNLLRREDDYENYVKVKA
jgi:hypothetical protein